MYEPRQKKAGKLVTLQTRRYGFAGRSPPALHNCEHCIRRQVLPVRMEGDFLFFGFVVGLESEFGYFLLSEL